MDSVPSNLSTSNPATLPTTGPLKSSVVVAKIGKFEGQLDDVEKRLPDIAFASKMAQKFKEVVKRVEAQEKEVEALKKENKLLQEELAALTADYDATSDEGTEDLDKEEETELTKIEETVELSSLAFGDNTFKGSRIFSQVK
ncbi:hypothetical protein H0H87_009030, partial [Tephrocybe sp. NHM501043]